MSNSTTENPEACFQKVNVKWPQRTKGIIFTTQKHSYFKPTSNSHSPSRSFLTRIPSSVRKAATSHTTPRTSASVVSSHSVPHTPMSLEISTTNPITVGTLSQHA